MSHRYEVRFSASAKRALSRDLPEKVAAAAFEFIVGPLAANPYRVGKQLREPLFPLFAARRSEYRVTYRIDGERVVIHIVSVVHRHDAYRSH